MERRCFRKCSMKGIRELCIVLALIYSRHRALSIYIYIYIYINIFGLPIYHTKAKHDKSCNLTLD